MKAVCTQNTGRQVETWLSLLSPLVSYTFLYFWTYFLLLPMIFSGLFLYHPLLFSLLVQFKAVPVPLEALALVLVNLFSLPVQRAVNFNRHNITRLFIPPVSLCFYRTRSSGKQNRAFILCIIQSASPTRSYKESFTSLLQTPFSNYRTQVLV